MFSTDPESLETFIVTFDSSVLTCSTCGSADIREMRADDCDAAHDDTSCPCIEFSCDDCGATWRRDDA
jgi:hypothetical protein